MLYTHDLDCQKILQAALILANREFSDAKIVQKVGLSRSKNTLQRFRTASLETYLARRGRLKLDYGVADKLWKFLEREGYVRTAINQQNQNDPQNGTNGLSLTEKNDLKSRLQGAPETNMEKRAERLAANFMIGFYNAARDEDEVACWRDKYKLQTEYLCYKPSFWRPGNVVKSRLKIEFRDDGYFHIEDCQYDNVSPRALRGLEKSVGFGFAKSRRLWFFMRERIQEQPRILCFTNFDFDEEERISLMSGFVLESDRRSTGGLFKFKIGCTSIHRDQATFASKYPADHYDPEDQVGNFTPPKKGLTDPESGNQVVFDADLIGYLRSDLEVGNNNQSLD